MMSLFWYYRPEHTQGGRDPSMHCEVRHSLISDITVRQHTNDFFFYYEINTSFSHDFVCIQLCTAVILPYSCLKSFKNIVIERFKK